MTLKVLREQRAQHKKEVKRLSKEIRTMKARSAKIIKKSKAVMRMQDKFIKQAVGTLELRMGNRAKRAL